MLKYAFCIYLFFCREVLFNITPYIHVLIHVLFLCTFDILLFLALAGV